MSPRPARTAAARPGRPVGAPAASPGRAPRRVQDGHPARGSGARPAVPPGARAPLAPDDPRGLGGYTLLGRLGEGGQGVVYLGRDADGELVTVKLLRGGDSAGERAHRRFVKEADAARRVSGRHTARVLDADMTGDRPYIVSEFVEGPPLQRVVEDRGPLPTPKLRKLALRTAAALAAIHRAGIVHRDFKPGNVLLGPDGAKVIDFGIARLDLDGDDATPVTTGPVGTPAYMAPEQIEDEPVGPPADVFAWGATLVFAATGRPPFGTGPSAAVMRRVTSRSPDLGDLEGPLRDLAARCLDKNPAARPTAPQIVRALREGQGPMPKPRPTRIPRYRWRMMVALAAVVTGGFVLGLLF
ncbi:serine/threonine protein kinase [Actinomadura pelletieri DSM 43383]|uniref:Serine/threonine protein kinase n=1 Tax=Actinomadura pelletieri DSM 43383 TaxID=1120940 RepID=A0A495QNP1_9ACTN|nr:serine/threonine-protein kinase [Actinomadura pelletieri]RKS74600.1 serine/threonine protein kinase [Actinomadura pelletieri DSM 43383]